MKLDAGQKHIMHLVARDAKPDGWTSVSEMLYPSISKSLPPELVTLEKLETGGRAKLTVEGQAVLNAMEWI